MNPRSQLHFIKTALFMLFMSPTLQAGFFKKWSEFNQKNCDLITESFDNFYEVEKDKLYRSQQLKPKTLQKYLKKYHIKTVISLRGKSGKSREQWWDTEEQIVKDTGATFVMLPMSAVRLSSKEELTNLLHLFDTAQKPLLIHCIGGADRTGEACALWVLEIQKKSKAEAFKQLSIKYGHRKYKNSAKDFLIEIWEGRDWLKNSYNPKLYPEFKAQEEQKKEDSQKITTEKPCALP